MEILEIGAVTVPSGTLRVFDCGALAFVLSGQIPEVPDVRVSGLPADRSLPLVAARVGDGDFADLWAWMRVVASDAPVARTEHAGEVIVDFARLLFADATIGAHWKHDEAIDGRADFAFWGRDAAALASELGAPVLEDPATFGWMDRSVEEAVALGTRAEQLRAERGWKLATDFRPHSHHYRALAIARRSSVGAGTIDVESLRVCLAFTSWGDGVFPVVREIDESGALAGVRVVLHTPESDAAMREVNGLPASR